MKKSFLVLLFLSLALNINAQKIEFERIGATSPLPTNVADIEYTFYNSVDYADIDNDGDDDLLITGQNETRDLVAILYKNDGSGNFSEVKGTPFEGVEFSTAAFADIDGDNDLDVVISGENSNNQLITKLYKNDGAGNFTLQNGTPFTGVRNGAIAFADIDSDNDQDLLLTGWSSNGSTANLYRNNGSGVFSLVTNTAFNRASYSSIAFGDLDGDNDLDVIISGLEPSANAYTRLYENNGSGSFSLQSSTPFIQAFRSSVALADIDGDNDLDVLVAGINNLVRNTALYTNNGNLNFSLVTGTNFDGIGSGTVAFSDIDGDNDQDIFITGRGNSSLIASLYLNNGLGTFSKVNNTPFDPIRNGNAVFSDIDGDNDEDLLIVGANYTSGTSAKATMYSNQGNGLFQEILSTPFEKVTLSAISYADVDGDNDLDVFICGRISGGAKVSNLYLNDSNGVYRLSTVNNFEAVDIGDAAFADIDGDNDLDLLISGADTSSQAVTKLYTNDGTGVFSLVLGTPFTAVRFTSLAFADIDNDSDQDVIISGHSSSGSSTNLYMNNGLGGFSQVNQSTIVDVSSGAVAFADIDGDGDQDLAIGGWINSSVQNTLLYTNNGSGTFTAVSNSGLVGGYKGDILFEDIDSDNDLDLFITGKDANYSRVTNYYLNNGSGSFTLKPNTPFLPLSDGSADFADIDGDNDLDLLTTGKDASNNKATRFYINNGNGVFVLRNNIPFHDVEYGAVAFGDIDGDNDPDLITSGSLRHGEFITNLYRNNTIPCQTSFDTTSIVSCDSLSWQQTNQTYRSSGIYSDTVQTAIGCDSVLVLELTINNTARDTTHSIVCNSYTWLQTGLTYNQTAYYYDTLSTSENCDSISVLNLVVNATNDTLRVSSCENYYWPTTGLTYLSSGYYSDTLLTQTSCDSILVLDLTINKHTNDTAKIIVCDEFLWSRTNQFYSQSGYYADTIPTQAACDSITVLDLTVYYSSSKDTTHVENCYSYNWLRTGLLYTSSGYYYDTLINQFGCDSVFVLDLTINPSQNDTLYTTSCSSFVWNRTNNTYLSSGTYYDYQTDSKGCDSTAVLYLTIHPAITAEAGPDVTTCSGSSAVIGGSPSGPAGATYIWSNASTLSNATSPNPIAFPSYTTLYYVTVSDTNSCSSIDSMTYFVNPNPTANAGPNQSICIGQSVPIGGSPTSTSVGASYQWDNSTTLSSSTVSNPMASPSISTNYTVTVTSAIGCSSTDSVSVSVMTSNPVDSITVSACDSYTWAQNNQTYFSSGSYHDTIAVSNGCDSIKTLNLTLDTVNTSIIQTGYTLTVAEAAAQYQWYNCNNSTTPVAITGETAQSYTASSNGNYSVQVTKNSCSKNSICINVLNVSVESNESSNAARIFPNPSKGNFIVELEDPLQSSQNILIYDLRGKLIESIPLSGIRSDISLKHISEGIYFVRIGSWKTKLIIL